MTTIALAEALCRDAAALLEAYQAGIWTPDAAEVELAEGLARGRWDGPFFRAALREVPPAARHGRLIEVLELAVEVLDQADLDGWLQAVVLQLRVLVDALATAP